MSIHQDDWGGLRHQLQFTPEGSINWESYPYARSWSMRRLGFYGICELIENCLSLKSECWMACSNPYFPTIQLTLQESLKQVATLRMFPCHYWLIDIHGRWLLEFSQDQILTLELFNNKDPKMVRYPGSSPTHDSRLDI